MAKGLVYRIALIAVLTIGSVVYLLPSLTTPPEWWNTFMPGNKIRLGLDLRGGTYLLLSIDLDAAVSNSLDRTAEDLRRALRAGELPGVSVSREENALRLKTSGQEAKNKTETLLSEQFPFLIQDGAPAAGEGEITLILDTDEIRRLHAYAVDQTLETLRNRIDQFGVSEPIVQRQGNQEIVVQLPGIQDTERAKRLIGQTAVLEFKLVALGAKGSQGTVTLNGQDRDPISGEIIRSEYVLEETTLMTGEMVADAKVRPSVDIEGPYVELVLTNTGEDLFEKITGDNVGRRLAIILDNTVYSAPNIRERIGGGRASITGSFDIKEARDLAIVLRAGALPAPVTIEEERTVGPSLGRDSIRQSVRSFIIGGIVVVLFMIIYYKLAGVLTDVAVGLNILYLLAALAMFEATLTLPGIAGIILTVGMAVDANVLINERMREELRLGKSARTAIQSGYEHARPAIFDSNITTFLSGLILFQFGSGPIRGFAVTLCIGIASTLFTALVVTRVVYDYFLAKRRLVELSV